MISSPPPFRLKPPQASENDIEAGCKTLLALRRYKVHRLQSGTFKSLDGRRHIRGEPKGTPDYLCVHGKHRSFYLETKRPDGYVSLEQQCQIDLLKLHYDLPTAVVRDARDLAAFLAEHERSP